MPGLVILNMSMVLMMSPVAYSPERINFISEERGFEQIKMKRVLKKQTIHGKEQEWKNGGYVQQRSSSCGRLKSFHVHNHVQEQRAPKTLYSEQTNREAKQANC